MKLYMLSSPSGRLVGDAWKTFKEAKLGAEEYLYNVHSPTWATKAVAEYEDSFMGLHRERKRRGWKIQELDCKVNRNME